MKTTHNIFIGLALLMIFSSCYKSNYYPCIKADTKLVEESRFVNDFNRIHLLSHANVIVTKGEEQSVIVVIPENFREYFITETKNNSLVIRSERCLKNRLSEITVYITIPHLSELKILGSGNIIIEDPFDGENLALHISGSGKIEILQSHFNTLRSDISGSGNIEVAGTAHHHSVQISGSGQVLGQNLICHTATVKIAGSGNARIFAESNLNVTISGSGNVYYRGNPNIAVTITGSGKLKSIS
jgi:hypothetical protein